MKNTTLISIRRIYKCCDEILFRFTNGHSLISYCVPSDDLNGTQSVMALLMRGERERELPFAGDKIFATGDAAGKTACTIDSFGPVASVFIACATAKRMRK